MDHDRPSVFFFFHAMRKKTILILKLYLLSDQIFFTLQKYIKKANAFDKKHHAMTITLHIMIYIFIFAIKNYMLKQVLNSMNNIEQIRHFTWNIYIFWSNFFLHSCWFNKSVILKRTIETYINPHPHLHFIIQLSKVLCLI